jgi:hypothetical protein
MGVIINECLIGIWGWCDPEPPTHVYWVLRVPKMPTYTVVGVVDIERILIHWSWILSIGTIIVLSEKKII